MSAYLAGRALLSREAGWSVRGGREAARLLGALTLVAGSLLAPSCRAAEMAVVYSVQAVDTDDVSAAKKSLSDGLKVFGRLPLTAAPPASPAAPGPNAATIVAPPVVAAPAGATVTTTQGASAAVGDPSVPRPAPGVGLPEADQARFLDMAATMVKRGDIAGARVVLGKLERIGNGRAAFELAQTFDPRVLDSWNVRGIRPDPERARTLYEEAYRLGIAEAQDRVAGLDRPAK